MLVSGRDADVVHRLESAGRIKRGAAQELGMPASTLESKIKAFQIAKRRLKPVPPS